MSTTNIKILVWKPTDGDGQFGSDQVEWAAPHPNTTPLPAISNVLQPSHTDFCGWLKASLSHYVLLINTGNNFKPKRHWVETPGLGSLCEPPAALIASRGKHEHWVWKLWPHLLSYTFKSNLRSPTHSPRHTLLSAPLCDAANENVIYFFTSNFQLGKA